MIMVTDLYEQPDGIYCNLTSTLGNTAFEIGVPLTTIIQRVSEGEEILMGANVCGLLRIENERLKLDLSPPMKSKLQLLTGFSA